MTVMRRNGGWAFVAWVKTADGGRRQVWQGGYRTKPEAAGAERRFLVDAEDAANQPAELPVDPGPTVAAFLTDWLTASEPTRRPTTSVSYERMVAHHVIPHLGELGLRDLAPAHLRVW